jgi:phytoene synthase
VSVAGLNAARRQAALDSCAGLTRRSGSNFYLAFLPLPKERRLGIFCVYAFCRRIDDIVDEPVEGRDPRAELEAWRARVERILAGTLSADDDPIAVGLALTHERFGLRGEDLHAVIDGMEMDLTPHRYADDDELGVYCRRVAGHVGCLCLPVFGCKEPASRDFAMKLGHAFQLTNILRDVAADAREGRIYLPQAELARHGVEDDDLLSERRSPEVRALLACQGRKAERLFHEAAALLPSTDRRALFSASIMAAIYRRILEQMRDTGYEIWGERPGVSKQVKGLLALGVLLRDRALHLS